MRRGFLVSWFLANHFESGRRRPPLPHRDASRSLTESLIDIAESLAQLSASTIFELRGEWRRLHRAPPPMRLSRAAVRR
jgi:hypothetical protein